MQILFLQHLPAKEYKTFFLQNINELLFKNLLSLKFHFVVKQREVKWLTEGDLQQFSEKRNNTQNSWLLVLWLNLTKAKQSTIKQKKVCIYIYIYK